MNDKDEEFEIYLKYHKANFKSRNNENKLKVLDIEKIKTIITQFKEQNKYEKVVSIAARKLADYMNGEDQQYISLGKIRDVAILLNVTLSEILTDSLLENIFNANTKL